ncbi:MULTISPECIES: hypothetical protein, partial [Pseudomonadota]|uniref:hypothetical protein n=1 Tax=Pseudomonadota TaxID=1224 RepID=UPI00209E42D1
RERDAGRRFERFQAVQECWFCGSCLQVKKRPVIGTGKGHVQHGKQLVLGPLAALHFGEDGSTDKDFSAGVLLAGNLGKSGPLAGR